MLDYLVHFSFLVVSPSHSLFVFFFLLLFPVWKQIAWSQVTVFLVFAFLHSRSWMHLKSEKVASRYSTLNFILTVSSGFHFLTFLFQVPVAFHCKGTPLPHANTRPRKGTTVNTVIAYMRSITCLNFYTKILTGKTSIVRKPCKVRLLAI